MVDNLSVLVNIAQLEDQITLNLVTILEVFRGIVRVLSNASRIVSPVGPIIIIEDIPLDEQQEVGSILHTIHYLNYLYAV